MEKSKRTRKNITVAEVVAEVNRQLALPEKNMSEEEKKGLCGFVEHLLLSTNNYNGYTNVDWQNSGWRAWKDEGEPDFPEKQVYIGREWSREYYIK
jgi:hypothetical protein